MSHPKIDEARAKHVAELAAAGPLGTEAAKRYGRDAAFYFARVDEEQVPLVVSELERLSVAYAKRAEEKGDAWFAPESSDMSKTAGRVTRAPRPSEALQTAIKAAQLQQIGAKWKDPREPEMLLEWLNNRKIARLTARVCVADDGDKIERLALREAHRPLTFRGAVGYSNWHDSFVAISTEDDE